MRDDCFRESRCERASVIVRNYPSGPQAALGEWRGGPPVPWATLRAPAEIRGGCQSRGGNAYWCQSCETKPIAPERRERQMLCGERVMTNWTRKGPWPNKANSHRGTADRAKQTQSAVAGCTNKANGPAEGPGGRTNEANSRERRRDIRLPASL
jgi:hypothetical protein